VSDERLMRLSGPLDKERRHFVRLTLGEIDAHHEDRAYSRPIAFE